MAHYPHTLSDGLEIRIALKRSAKKNLILRPINAHEISINIPPFLSESRLKKWLDENETLLRKTLARKPAAPDPHEKPGSIWYRGVQTALGEHGAQTIALMPSEILLPQKDWDAQKNHLRHFLTERAAE
ncbi:YgjP-like metallopeptidase domain-containing protein, partial [Neisseria chenwenguii]